MASYRILIVEDQREMSQMLHSALETLGVDIQVVEMPSGEEAILDSARNRIDLLVADYRLPGMTGIELMDRIRRFHKHMKVFLITGQTDPKIRKVVAEAQADAFFIKPIVMEDFLDAVERHLGLVETLLPPEPILAVEDPEEEKPSLPDKLSSLRQELKATAVLLISEAGRVLARAGDLPDADAEVSLFSSILSIYSAGTKISHLLGQDMVSNWSIFESDKFDLIFTPMGEMFALLVIGEGLAGEERLTGSMEILRRGRIELEVSMEEAGFPEKTEFSYKEPATTPLEVVEKSARELEPLFTSAKKKLKTEEVDDFWNQAARNQKAPTKPDMLSYEQARQLGLAPEDEG